VTVHNLRAALARLVAERDDAIAQLQDADEGTDAATQTAERVVRELRQEYADVIDRLEKQAARGAALRAEIDRMRAEADTMRHRIAALREALEDVREWAKHDHVMRFDDGDVSLADYCTQAIQGGK
jgi:chromosome segregation ATPase